ncbi:MAG: DNA/RNA non-specific endonuclease [Bacteroidota bacterium]
MKTLKKIIVSMMVVSFVLSCTQENITPLDPASEGLNIVGEIDVAFEEGVSDKGLISGRTTGFTETFGSGSKNAYAGGNVNLSSGTWYMTDALIGTLSNDRKFGSKSVRMRNTGYITMSFDMDNGASTVRVNHAKYGSDGNSSWRLIASYDGGNSWYYAGSTINTTSTSLKSVTFNVNVSSRVRFGVYKTGGGSNRINIDNFEVVAAGSAPANRDGHLTFGNPSDASSSANNYLINRGEYSYAYDNSKGRIKWVSWHLSTAWLGSVGRSNDFRTDTALPGSFYRANSGSYSGSGFDRGHICPSADRTYSSGANSNTFYMTNMGPQAPNNNRVTWVGLENYLRDVARDGNEIHIIAGMAGQGGTGSKGFKNTIASGNIDVPSSFWKVAIILPNGSSDVNRVTTSTRVIAVNMPNTQSINSNWANYRTSVDYIESITGLNLLENIPNSIESVLESRVDNGPTN